MKKKKKKLFLNKSTVANLVNGYLLQIRGGAPVTHINNTCATCGQDTCPGDPNPRTNPTQCHQNSCDYTICTNSEPKCLCI